MQTAKRLADRINSLDLSLNQSWEKDWQRHTLAGIEDTALIARDGRTFKRELQVRFVPDAVAARRLGTIWLRRLRPDRRWLVVDPPATERAGPGDHVTLDFQAIGGPTQVAQVERVRLLTDLSTEYDVIASPAGTYADTLDLPDLDTWQPTDPDAPVEALTGLAHTVRFSVYTDGSIREFVDVTWDKPEAQGHNEDTFSAGWQAHRHRQDQCVDVRHILDRANRYQHSARNGTRRDRQPQPTRRPARLARAHYRATTPHAWTRRRCGLPVDLRDPG